MEWHHLSARVHRGGSKQRQLKRIPVESGHLFGQLSIDNQVAAGAIKLHRHRSIGYRHRFLNAPGP
jgi:hypothetical protein